MKIRRVTVRMYRKFVPPNGDRFQPYEIGSELVADLEEGDVDRVVRDQLRSKCVEELDVQQEEVSQR